MSESKHTPGPWAVHSIFPNVVVPYDQSSRSLGASEDEDADRKRYAVPIATAERDKMSGFSHERTREEAEANARLIAAAPDLLAACEAMLLDYESQFGMDYCECDSSVGLTCNACRTRAAIAKTKEA
jgi:hypothetical protein